MYKVAAILYLVCFCCYVLFTRTPDYFDGEFVPATVTKATFSQKNKEPAISIDYRVGSETFHYTTTAWFLHRYKEGEKVTVIYSPDHPKIASLYAPIGYWIKWQELVFTCTFFIVLFFAAKWITGENSNETIPDDELKKKRKYDE